MLKMKEDILESMLEKAIKNIQNSNMKLVSYTKQIDEINPLGFFESAKHIQGNRTFWKSSVDDYFIIGVGSAWTIATEHHDLMNVQDIWRDIRNESMIHNPYRLPGTGILALGGMAFDPKNEKTNVWKNFKTNHFTIPEFMVTKYKDNYYFTTTVRVDRNDHAKQLLHQIKEKENQLFTSEKALPENAQVIAKEEVESSRWKQTVAKATKEIKTNNVEKIVLAREIRLKLSEEAEISAVLNELMDTQPNSYIFAFEHGDDCFVGATPERLVKLEGNQLLSTCLAGTAPRGRTIEEDEKYKYSLLSDEKNRREHDFVVQMIKRAMEDYCSDIDIPKEPGILPLTNLQHLYTPVRAVLKSGFSIFNVIDSLHPTPALGGTPREESLSFIRENEEMDRGWYGAPIGWLDSNENGEFAVAIRSGLIRQNEVSLYAGCGIVKDSDPEAEYEETNIKFLPMLSVLGGA